MSQWALAWVLHRPEVTAAIIGARQVVQLNEFIPARQWERSPKERAKIDVHLAK